MLKRSFNSTVASLCAAFALLISSGLALAADTPAAGLYNVTATTTMSGMGMSRNHEGTQCITEDQFTKDPQEWIGADQDPGQTCTVERYELGNGQMSMILQCSSDQGNATINGNGTYTRDSFTMDQTMKVSAQGMEMEFNTKLVGTRAGDC
ncbi:MAG: DUF3617 family protein [Pseudomonadota bacterium]